MSLWFTSDLHLGHRFVAGLRGFDSVEEHDQTLLDNWDKTVNAGDTVWVLGDIAVSNPKQAIMELHGLPGTKHLVAGNHDPCHPMHRESYKHQRAYFHAFESVQAFARRRINGKEVLLSHFPYGADHSPEPRYTQYRLRDEGLPLLHGHTHGTEQLHGNQLHVGVDAWDLTPVSLEAVAALLSGLQDSSPELASVSRQPRPRVDEIC